MRTLNPELCRELNHMSLELLANYLSVDLNLIKKYYTELLNDEEFLSEINEQIIVAREFYKKGICKHEKLESIDYMAIQRIILYILVRLYKPKVCVETGVFYGGTTCFILNALRRNGVGKLISIDLPANEIKELQRHHFVGDSEFIAEGLDVGFLVHKALKNNWTLIRGNSHEEIPKLNEKIDLFLHDSEHTFDFFKKEISMVFNKLSDEGLIMVDDLDWSNGFFNLCVEKKLYPLIITDNGKSGLKARTGIIKLGHKLEKEQDVVG